MNIIKLSAALAGLIVCGPCLAQPLEVRTSTTDLASLAGEVGGEEVHAVSLARGTENPHFVEARPSLIKELAGADLFIQIGLDLEVGWLPVLLRGGRNARVQPGGAGFLDASSAVTPIEAPRGAVDRSQGDVHALGNPHYLLDPLNGWRVAQLIRDKLTELRPSKKDLFERRFADFQSRLCVALVGEGLAGDYDHEMLLRLIDGAGGGGLDAFLERQGQSGSLGGWLERLKPFRGAPVIGDHNMWNYFFRRFDLNVVGYMEPRPGLSPTTKHMRALVETAQRDGARLVIASVYFDARYTDLIVKASAAPGVVLAHQVGSAEWATDYLAIFEGNVSAIERAMGERKR